MKKAILFLILFIFLAAPLLKAEEISLTLDEAIAIALRDNRDILIKTEEVKEAKSKIAEARASLFPTLSFTGSWTYSAGYYANKDIGQTSTQTTLKQYLYKGGKTINTIKYDGYKFIVAQALLDKSKLEAVLDVQKAFYTLLLAEELVQLNKSILENTQEHLNFMKKRFQNGQASESDILNLEASLENVKEAHEVSLNQMESARVLLNNLLYLDKEARLKAQGDFVYAPEEIAYDEAFLKAMRNRPEIKQYEAQMQADRRNIEIAKSDNRPNIYASWDYYSRSHAVSTTVNTRNWNDYNIYAFTFSWPIFDGWATKAKVEQAIADLKETQFLKEKTVNDIALELKNAYLDLKNAVAKIKSSQKDLDLYKDKFSVAQEKYKAGQASSLDLSDASLGYAVSLFNQKEVIYDYVLAKARFDKATGGL